jgi:hypothetical protein
MEESIRNNASPSHRNEDRFNYEETLREMRVKEKELSSRTEMLENMVRTLTSSFSASTPIESATGSAPPFGLQSPHSQSLPATNSFSQMMGYSKSYLRDALELVPKYDGHNIPVWQFARACKRAKESLPLADEAFFVRMLRNKLTHHAYLAVEDEIHPTVELFLDSLKRTFGSGRSSNYYRGQLSMAYKKPNEHILDYIGRIKDLKASIIDGDQTNLGRQLSNVEIAAIESFALEAFFEGLPREYRTELRAEGFCSLPDACSKVLIINKRLEREEARYRNTRTHRDNPAPAQQPQIFQRNPPVGPNGPPGVANAAGRKICGFCKNIGHLVHECRKRMNHERFSNNNNNNNYVNDNNNGYNRVNSNINNNDNRRNYVNNSPPRNTGNHREVSANGASRDLGTARSTLCIRSTPGPSTSSAETTELYQPLSSNHPPSEDQSRSCSTPERSLT